MVTVTPVGPDVGLRVIDAGDVTVKGAVELAEPLTARTVPTPGTEPEVTLKDAVKEPEDEEVMVAGVVTRVVPLKVRAIVELDG